MTKTITMPPRKAATKKKGGAGKAKAKAPAVTKKVVSAAAAGDASGKCAFLNTLTLLFNIEEEEHVFFGKERERK